MTVEVMGIVNVTPDSFSDGGLFADRDAAVQHGRDMVSRGATIIDVGGESTRPGATPVDSAEEMRRTVPVVEELASLGTVVSIDTRHADVARAAVAAGATIVNDVSAGLGDVAADLGVTWIAMHMAGDPATMQDEPRYDDVVSEVLDHLVSRARAAQLAGAADVWIDPGIGFGKDLDHNLALLAAVDRFVETGYRVVVGVSRKRMLGTLTARSDAGRMGSELAEPAPLSERGEAGLALGVWAALEGASVLRVHDVAPHAAALAALNLATERNE